MVLGQKLWEGKGKSMGVSIKSVGVEGITQEYSWIAQVKGLGCAQGLDGSLVVTAMGTSPPKGVGSARDQGMFNTTTGDMALLKGYDLAKMDEGKGKSVGLWGFMTMSEKMGWMNELIALVTFEALDLMWQEFNVIIYEWK